MNLSVILLVLAILCFLIVALIGFGVVSSGVVLVAWVGLGLAFFAAAHLPI